MSKYVVSIGTDFAVDGVEIEDIEAVERLATISARRNFARNQTRFSYWIVAVIMAAIAVASLMGWRDGSYNEVQAVWNYGGPWIGAVIGHYLKKD